MCSFPNESDSLAHANKEVSAGWRDTLQAESRANTAKWDAPHLDFPSMPPLLHLSDWPVRSPASSMRHGHAPLSSGVVICMLKVDDR